MKVLHKLKTFKYEILVGLLFILSRLPDLGHDTFNTDVWKWKARIFNFGSGVFGFNFIETIQRYHPGVTLMWLGTFAVKLNSFYYRFFLGTIPPDNDISSIFTLHFFQKLVIVVVLGIVLASIFYVLHKSFSLLYASVVTTLVAFEPFYVGLTRVIHLEGLMSTFMIASFVWLYYFLDTQTVADFKPANKKALIISAVFGGLAFLTKTSSLFLLGFVPLMLLINFYLGKASLAKAVPHVLKVFLVWCLVALTIIIVLWPALWVDPEHVIRVLYSGIFDTGVDEGHEQLYFGVFMQDPGFTFYPVVFLLRSSPYLILGMVGAVLTYRKQSSVSRRFLLFSLLFSLLYAIEMSVPSKKLDRYLLPSLMGVAFISAAFITHVIEKFKYGSIYLLFLIIFIPSFLTVWSVHPDYFSYYNPMFGGLKKGIHIIEPKWLIGAREVTAYFEHVKQAEGYEDFQQGEAFDRLFANDALGNRLVIGFPEKYYTQIHPFIREIGAWATIKDLTPHAKATTFFVYPVWEDDSYKEDRFYLEYAGTINLRSVPVYNVYKRVPYE